MDFNAELTLKYSHKFFAMANLNEIDFEIRLKRESVKDVKEQNLE